MNKVYRCGKVYIIARNAAHALEIKSLNGLRGVVVELTLKKVG